MSISISIWHLSREVSAHRYRSAASRPYSLIHSPRSFLDPDSCCKSCIRCTATTEPWLALWALGRTWDRTGGLQVHRQECTNKCVNVTSFFSCWVTAVTHLHHCRREKNLLELKALTKSNLAAKRVFKHKWQSVRAALLLRLKSSKQDGRVWDRNPLRKEEEDKMSSAFTKQCQASVRVLQREKGRLYKETIRKTQTCTWMRVQTLQVCYSGSRL